MAKQTQVTPKPCNLGFSIVGDQYFSNLSSRSFFQDVKVNDYNEVISCKMHELIHDLAIRVADFDCAIAETYEDNISDKVHHVSIVYDFAKLPRKLLKAKGLRTILHTSNAKKMYFYEASILMTSKFRWLRVLDVHSCEVENVSSSIGKLQHLRYLDLSENSMTSLPNSIRKLVNLQTLKLSCSYNLERLPEGITKLINLRYLMIDVCWKLNHMPTGMGKLTSLRRLNKFVMGRNNNRSVRLRELNGLNELRGDISIEGLENVNDVRSEAKEANLMARQYLNSLTLEWRTNNFERKDTDGDDSNSTDEEILLEGLQPHQKLRELSIEGYRSMMFPSWMTMGNILISLPNIVSITLVGCDGCQHLPPSLDQLPFLKSLTLRWLKGVEHITDDDINNLARKSLTTFVFFPSLERLVMTDLPRLKGWWRAAGISMTAGEEEEEEELSQRLSFPRLTILAISSCNKLTSMPIHPSHLKELVVRSVPERLLRQLLTTTITEGSASSSSSSIPSSKLRSLRISFIDDLESLPEELLQNLTSLEQIDISSCPRLSCFAVSDKEGFRALPSLRSLSIWWCDSLTSLSGITQHLTAHQDLTIRSCQNFDLSDDHGVHWQGLMSLRELVIANIPKLVSLPVGLQQVTTLQRLEIYECPGLMALPDWLINLTSLQMLDISNCPLLSKRCRKETGEDWSKISHIPQILIDYKTIQGRG